MITVAVASILLASGSTLMIYMFKKNSQQIKVARMYSELLPVFNIVTRRIAMAGAWADAQTGIPYSYYGGGTDPGVDVTNPFTAEYWDLRVDPSDGCLLFSYDRNRDGVAAQDERMGYRLSEGGLEEGSSATSCSHGDWAALTSNKVIKITSIQFIISEQAVPPSFIKRAVHIKLRAEPASVSGPTIFLQRTVRVRNDKVQ